MARPAKKAPAKKTPAKRAPAGRASGRTATRERVTSAEVDVVDTLAEEGEVMDVIHVRDRTFTVVEDVPGFVLARLGAAGDNKTPPAKQMSAIVAFLERVVVEGERDEFIEFLQDAEPVIDFEELNDILEEAGEVLGGRPS